MSDTKFTDVRGVLDCDPSISEGTARLGGEGWNKPESEKMKNLTVFYRISDKGNVKNRLLLVNNRNCLESFLKEFPAAMIEMIADNVNEETWRWLGSYRFKKLHKTSLGNSGSFWYCYQLAAQLPINESVYFVENDYIHLPNSKRVLMEGLAMGDYVTLYDHPDKYVDGFNPAVKNGGEKSKVLLSKSTHWKVTNSTTMTFASNVSCLRKDQLFFKYYSVGILKKGLPLLRRFQGSSCPDDYRIFNTLRILKRRVLISPIPGYSTHGEKQFLTPFGEWEDYIEQSGAGVHSENQSYFASGTP
ncbi:MAG: hypothetical protein WCL08_08545 [Verrucomicrobiota bacterium]